MAAVHTYTAKLDTTNDTFVYELYYDKAIAAGQEIIVFETDGYGIPAVEFIDTPDLG